MELDTAIEKRMSTRKFKDKKVSWKKVIDAIYAANQAPFADNRNHLKFIIIESQEKIDKIAELSEQLWINETNLLVVVCSNDKNLEDMHGDRGRVYSRQQSGAAIENFLLKLTDLGLSSCWVGSYPDELVKQHLEIPGNIQIEAIIPIGYSAEKPVKKKKKALDSTIFWESWGNDRRPTGLENANYHDEGMLY
jgi:nitroreductase